MAQTSVMGVYSGAFDYLPKPFSQMELLARIKRVERRLTLEPDLPPLSIQYADFAAWQLQRVESEEMAEQVDWWREQLADLEPLDVLKFKDSKKYKDRIVQNLLDFAQHGRCQIPKKV